MAKIEEILGFTSSSGKDAETVSKRYYVKCGPNEGPNDAKTTFQNFAVSLPVPTDMERGDVGLEEDKNVNGLYYGTVTFNSPSPKIKKKIADDLFETFGEKMSEGRKSGSHERFFRVKSDTAKQAMTRLENHIRSTAETSGRLHIGDISVDEEPGGDGFYSGHVVYSNPDTFGNRDKLNGIVPAYGSRYSANRTSRSREHVFELRGYNSVQDAWNALANNYRNGDKAAELTFKFAVSPNAWNIRVGSMMIPFKYGWDYLWVRWADLKRGSVTVKIPVEAYVEKVYQGLNFNSLGIN